MKVIVAEGSPMWLTCMPTSDKEASTASTPFASTMRHVPSTHTEEAGRQGPSGQLSQEGGLLGAWCADRVGRWPRLRGRPWYKLRPLGQGLR